MYLVLVCNNTKASPLFLSLRFGFDYIRGVSSHSSGSGGNSGVTFVTKLEVNDINKKL